MPKVVKIPSAPLDSMLTHSWLLQDQEAAFATSPFLPDPTSVSSYLSPWFVAKSYGASAFNGAAIYIKDAKITACLMNQALDFLQRALCNTMAHYILARSGLETWARVTNYYASYFSVHSLLCLQGRTITKLELDKSKMVHVLPIDFRNHVFGITDRHLGKNPHHETPWRRFYDSYDRYAVSHQAYETVARRAHVTDPADESIERNMLNYTPFKGFSEIRDLARHKTFSDAFANYVAVLMGQGTLAEFLADLQAYASDPEYKYFARTLLKLALAGDIILRIRAANQAIELEWTSMRQRWLDFLATVFPNPTECYLPKFVPLIGSTLN
jgi:hypothetical protein